MLTAVNEPLFVCSCRKVGKMFRREMCLTTRLRQKFFSAFLRYRARGVRDTTRKDLLKVLLTTVELAFADEFSTLSRCIYFYDAISGQGN